MADYANDALRYHATHMWHRPYTPKKRPRCSCVECHKEVEASEGLAMHIKRKHPTNA